MSKRKRNNDEEEIEKLNPRKKQKTNPKKILTKKTKIKKVTKKKVVAKKKLVVSKNKKTTASNNNKNNNQNKGKGKKSVGSKKNKKQKQEEEEAEAEAEEEEVEEEEVEEEEVENNNDEEEEEEEEEELWEGWKQIYLVGTEWENYDSVYDINWDFSHLEEDLQSDGELSKLGNTPYIYGVTEPQLLILDKKTRQSKVILVPVIIVVNSSIPPPSTVSITSIMRTEEEIIPMKKLKMDWLPFYVKSKNAWKNRPASKNLKPSAMILQCSQRRTALSRVPTMRKKDFEYAIPYIWIPKYDQGKSYDTVVHVVHSVGGIGLNYEYDWKFDEYDEFIPDLLKGYELPDKHFDEIKEFIETTVNDKKSEIRAERAARKKKIEETPQEVRDELDRLECFKYYPKNDIEGLAKVNFINRYYGKATKIN